MDCPLHHYLFDLNTGRNLYPFPIYPTWKQEEVGDLSLAIFLCREKEVWCKIAKILLENGADIKAKQQGGWTPFTELQIAGRKNSFHSSCPTAPTGTTQTTEA